MDEEHFERAVDALRAGLVVVLPTDTVYGVAALPSVPGATLALQRLKDRALDQALAVLVGSLEQALALVEPPSPAVRRLMDDLWPGPLTLVANRSGAAADLELGGDPASIGVRWPADPFVERLALAVGPIATTSANRHGEPTPAEAQPAADSLLGPVAAVIDGGRLDGIASTVVNVRGSAPVVLREGAISAADVERRFADL
jgi:tRNA threonylcarbamoyl adenosine modification protein (Sua5/YciO/YrdC/YwlC family)